MLGEIPEQAVRKNAHFSVNFFIESPKFRKCYAMLLSSAFQKRHLLRNFHACLQGFFIKAS
jgi:hypothetical protein